MERVLVINHESSVARLYDAHNSGCPIELTVARGHAAASVVFVIANLNSGDEWVIDVDRAQLEAALAVTQVKTVSQD